MLFILVSLNQRFIAYSVRSVHAVANHLEKKLRFAKWIHLCITLTVSSKRLFSFKIQNLYQQWQFVINPNLLY